MLLRETISYPWQGASLKLKPPVRDIRPDRPMSETPSTHVQSIHPPWIDINENIYISDYHAFTNNRFVRMDAHTHHTGITSHLFQTME